MMNAPYDITMLNGIESNFPMGDLKNNEVVLVRAGEKVSIPGGGKSITGKTVQLIEKIKNDYLEDTAIIAEQLKGNSLHDTLQNNWEFVKHNFRFRKDAPGKEQLRRPIRSVADRNEGIDCDCMVLLLSSILTNQGISHAYRRAMYPNDRDFSHIYIVVPKPGRNGYFTVDTVLNQFNYEKPFMKHSDHNIHLSGLDGFFDDVESFIGKTKDSTGFKLVSGADKALKSTGVAKGGLLSLLPDGKVKNTTTGIRSLFSKPTTTTTNFQNNLTPGNGGGNNLDTTFDKAKIGLYIFGGLVGATALFVALKPAKKKPKPTEALNGTKSKKKPAKKKTKEVTI